MDTKIVVFTDTDMPFVNSIKSVFHFEKNLPATNTILKVENIKGSCYKTLDGWYIDKKRTRDATPEETKAFESGIIHTSLIINDIKDLKIGDKIFNLIEKTIDEIANFPKLPNAIEVKEYPELSYHISNFRYLTPKEKENLHKEIKNNDTITSDYIVCIASSVSKAYTQDTVYKRAFRKTLFTGSIPTELDNTGSATNGYSEKFFRPATIDEAIQYIIHGKPTSALSKTDWFCTITPSNIGICREYLHLKGSGWATTGTATLLNIQVLSEHEIDKTYVFNGDNEYLLSKPYYKSYQHISSSTLQKIVNLLKNKKSDQVAVPPPELEKAEDINLNSFTTCGSDLAFRQSKVFSEMLDLANKIEGEEKVHPKNLSVTPLLQGKVSTPSKKMSVPERKKPYTPKE